MQPFKVLQEAIRAVPAMRYALGVAGIVAVVAITVSFRLDPKVAVFGAIITLGLMVALVVFAKLSTTAPKHFLKPVLVMMWSFLVLVIAQAALLFSAVSFKQPKPLHDWLFSPPPPPGSNQTASAEISAPEISPDILQAARLQSDAGDHAGAWKQIEAALKTAPSSTVGQRLQAEIAMKWLRGCYGSDHSELVDSLSPCLYRAANATNNVWAADVHAHIGWGNYLKSKAGHDLDFEGPFKRAIALDPKNTFGHAMLGYCLVWGGKRSPTFKEASHHFDIAAQSGREKDYVRSLQLAALGSRRVSEHTLDFIRVLNGIRRTGEPLSEDLRRAVVRGAYWSEWESIWQSINGAQPVLPAAEHLDLLKWLIDDIGNHTVHADVFIARLTEQTGDRAGALALYRALTEIKYPGPGYRELEKDILEGIARCTR